MNQSWPTLVNTVPDLIIRYDSNGRITFANRALKEQLGLSGSDIVGKLIGQVLTPDSLAAGEWDKMLQQALTAKSVLPHTGALTTIQGKKYYHTLWVPQVEELDRSEAVLSISRDVTAQIILEEQLSKAQNLAVKQQEKLQKINEHLEQFVYTVAHDLRAPVSNLKMLSALLSKRELNAANLPFIENIAASVKRLENTVNGLVEVLEVQSTFQVRASAIDVRQALKEVETELAGELAKAGGELEADFSHCATVTYLPAYLKSIFYNLLSNAVKYRHPQRALLIRVTAHREQDLVRLVFKDNGVGMDLTQQGHKLFQPFSRLTLQAEGKGIGLYLIKNMLEKNGGCIQVESTPGEGSLFTCCLKEYSGSLTQQD